ncbi:MAG: YjgP/YjgQ family permease [Planctomycetes bacterium]|nr:YjgP/YjgQ family permease [Planctomycetota bacterium]
MPKASKAAAHKQQHSRPQAPRSYDKSLLILGRSYFGEILRHLLMVLAGMVFLLSLGAAVRASSTAQGAPLSVVLTLVPLFVGNALPYFLPVALMTAVVLTYGRMAADGEEVALFAAGIRPTRLMRPAILAGVLLAAISYPLTSQVMPALYKKMRELSLHSRIAALENTNPGANEFHFKGLHMIWKERDPRGGFKDVVVSVDQGDGLRLRANRARMDVADKSLVFRFDHLRTLSDQSNDVPWQASTSDTTWVTIDLDSLLAEGRNDKKLIKVSNTTELLKRVEDETDPVIKRKMWMVYYQRWVNALKIIPVALLGAVIGWRLRRGGFLTGFAVALFIMLLVDYPLHFFGENLGRSGILPPALAASMPVFGILLVVSGLAYQGRRA